MGHANFKSKGFEKARHFTDAALTFLLTSSGCERIGYFK
jgi:hypothetical protein